MTVGKPRRRSSPARARAVAQQTVVRNLGAEGLPVDAADCRTEAEVEAWKERMMAGVREGIATDEALARAKAEGVVLGAVQAKHAAWVQVEQQRVAREKAKALAMLAKIRDGITPDEQAWLDKVGLKL